MTVVKIPAIAPTRTRGNTEEYKRACVEFDALAREVVKPAPPGRCAVEIEISQIRKGGKLKNRGYSTVRALERVGALVYQRVESLSFRYGKACVDCTEVKINEVYNKRRGAVTQNPNAS